MKNLFYKIIFLFLVSIYLILDKSNFVKPYYDKIITTETLIKIIGNNNVNSMSYKIKKIHNIEKFKFIWIFNSDIALKPHS